MSNKITRITKKSLSVLLCFIMMFSTLLVGTVSTANAANTVGGGYLYFDNSVTQWTDSYIYFCIGHSSYTSLYQMTKVSNTNLYYAKMDSWDGSTYYAVIGTSGSWGSGSWGSSNLSNANHYTAAYTSTYSLNSGTYYMFTPASSSNKCSLSISYKSGTWNYTNYFYKYLTEDGSTYSSNAACGTVKATGYYQSGVSATGTRSLTSDTSSTYKSNTFVYSSTISLTATPATGYEFVGWSTSTSESGIVSTSTTYSYTASKSTTKYYALFKETTYAVSVVASPTAGGSVSPTSLTVGSINEKSITATANSGYEFAGWTASTSSITIGSASSASTTVLASAAGTVTANFIKTQAVNFSSVDSNASLTGEYTYDGATSSFTTGKEIKVGSTVTLTATVEDGYKITTDGWSGVPDDATISDDGSTCTFTVESDVTYNITFEATPIGFTINFAENYADGGTFKVTDPSGKVYQDPSSVIDIYKGQTVTIEIEVDAPYTFESGISCTNGTLVADANNTGTTFDADADKSVSGYIKYTYTMGDSDADINIDYLAVLPTIKEYNVTSTDGGFKEKVSDNEFIVYANSTIDLGATLYSNSGSITSYASSTVTVEDGVFTVPTTIPSSGYHTITVSASNSPQGVTVRSKTFTVKIYVEYTEVQQAYLDLSSVISTCGNEQDKADGYLTEDVVWSTYVQKLEDANNALGEFPTAMQTEDSYTAVKTALEASYDALKSIRKTTSIYVLSKREDLFIKVSEVDSLFLVNINGTEYTTAGNYQMTCLGEVSVDTYSGYYIHKIDYMGKVGSLVVYHSEDSNANVLTSTFDNITYGDLVYFDCKSVDSNLNLATTYSIYESFNVTVSDGVTYQGEEYNLTSLVTVGGSFVNSGVDYQVDSYLLENNEISYPTTWISEVVGEYSFYATASVTNSDDTTKNIFDAISETSTITVKENNKVSVDITDNGTVTASFVNVNKEIVLEEGQSNYCRDGVEVTLDVEVDKGYQFEYYLVNDEICTQSEIIVNQNTVIVAVISEIVDVQVVFNQEVTLTSGEYINIQGSTAENEQVSKYVYTITVTNAQGDTVFTDSYIKDQAEGVNFENPSGSSLESGVYYVSASLKGYDQTGNYIIISGLSKEKPLFITDAQTNVIDASLTASYNATVYTDDNTGFFAENNGEIRFTAVTNGTSNATDYVYKFYKSPAVITSVEDLEPLEIISEITSNLTTCYCDILYTETDVTYYYVTIEAIDSDKNVISVVASSLYNGYISVSPMEDNHKLYFCVNATTEDQSWQIGDDYPVYVTCDKWDRESVTMYLNPDDHYAERTKVYMGYFTQKEITAIREYGCTFTQGTNVVNAMANDVVQEGYIYTLDINNAINSSIDQMGVWGEYNLPQAPSIPDNWNDVISGTVTDNSIVYYDNSITQWHEVWISCWKTSSNYSFKMNKLDPATGFDNIYYFDLNGEEVQEQLGENYFSTWLSSDERYGFLFLDRGGYYDDTNGKYIQGYGSEYAQSIDVCDHQYSLEGDFDGDVKLWTTFPLCNAPVYLGQWCLVGSRYDSTNYKMRSFASKFTDLYQSYVNNTVKTKTIDVYVDTHCDEDMDSVTLYTTSTTENFSYSVGYYYMSQVANSSIYYTSILAPYTGSEVYSTYFNLDKIKITKGEVETQLSVINQPDSKVISSGELWIDTNTNTYGNNGEYIATVNEISGAELSNLINVDVSTKRVYWSNDGYSFTNAGNYDNVPVYLHYDLSGGGTYTTLQMTDTGLHDDYYRKVFYADIPSNTKALYFQENENGVRTTLYNFTNGYSSDAGSASFVFYCNGDYASDYNFKVFNYSITQAPTITSYYQDATLAVGKTISVLPNAYTGTLTYESSDENVATVDSDGNVTANAVGEAEITITASSKTNIATVSTFGDTQSVKCKITVAEKSLSIDTGNDSKVVAVKEGKTSKINLNYTINNTSYTDASYFSFVSNDTSVATVDSTGTVTGVGYGFTTVTVKYSSEVIATVAVATEYADVLGYTHSTSYFKAGTGGNLEKSDVKAITENAIYDDDNTGYITVDGKWYKLIYAIPDSNITNTSVYLQSEVTEKDGYNFLNWTDNNSKEIADTTHFEILSADVSLKYYTANFVSGKAVEVTVNYEYYEFDTSNGIPYNPNKVSLKSESTVYSVNVKVPQATLVNADKLQLLYTKYVPAITSDYFEYVLDTDDISVFTQEEIDKGNITATVSLSYVPRQYTARIVNADGDETSFASYYQQKTYLLNASEYVQEDAPYGYIWYVYNSKGNRVILSTSQYYKLRITQNRTIYVMAATSPTAYPTTLINEPQYNLIQSGSALKVEMNMLIENYIPEDVEVLMTGAMYYFTDASDSVTISESVLVTAIENAYTNDTLSTAGKLGVLVNDGTYQIAGYRTDNQNSEGKFIFAPTATYTTSNYKYYKVQSYMIYSTDGGNTYTTIISSPVIASVDYYLD